jgi:hypothetical protein
MAVDPSVDFTHGSEDFGPANMDYQRTITRFRDEIWKVWNQLEPLFQGGVDQGAPVPVSVVRAVVRRTNRITAMNFAMMREAEKDRVEVASAMIRIEEAFEKVDSVVSDIDKKNVDLLAETRREAGVEFQRLSNEGSSVRDDLSRMKLEAEAALTQLKIEQEKLLKSAREKFVQIETDVQSLAPQISSVGGVGGGSSVHEGKKKSVLEYNVIKDYPVLGEDERHFREWHYKLKANLKAVLGHSCNITKWMDIAEKDACSVKKESEQDPFPEVGIGRSEAAADIEAIMINKLQEGSEAYLILRGKTIRSVHGE